MTVVDGFTRRCLRVAARRWPAHLREERYREWTAELHMIRSDSTVTAGQRVWEQLRYAFSLAASPPAPDENRVPRGWRELLPQAGRRLRPWALLVGMGMACTVLAGPVHGMVPRLVWAVTGGHPNGERPPAAVIASALTLLAVTGLVAWLGVVIGRRMPLLPDPGGRLARAVSVAGAPLAVGIGLLSVEAARVADYFSPDVTFAKSGLYGPLLWIVLFAPAALIAVRMVRRGRSGTGRAVGVAAGLLALELLAIPLTHLGAASMPVGRIPFADAALWFPMSIIDDPTQASYLGVTGVAQVMPALLVASAFTLWYSIAACRVRLAEPLPVAPTATAWLPAPSRPRTAFALAATAGGLAAWAIGVAHATPAASALTELGDSQFVLWAAELRLAAMALTSLALGLALVGRGRPIVACSAAAIGLLVTDTALAAFDRTGSAGLAGAIGFGLVVLAAAWWLGRTLLLVPPTPTTVRRGHIGIAVAAALTAPFILLQSTWPETASEAGPPVATPIVFPALTTTVTVLLAALAGVGAIAAWRRRVAPAAAALVIGVPVLVFGGFAVVSGQGARIDGYGPVAGLAFTLSLPYLTWLLATIWWDRARRRPRAAAIWAAVAVAGAPVTVAVLIAGFLLSYFVSTPLLALQGSGYPADGAAMLPGVIMLAIGAGSAAAMLLARPPRPEPAAVAPPVAAPSGIPRGRDPHPIAS